MQFSVSCLKYRVRHDDGIIIYDANFALGTDSSVQFGQVECTQKSWELLKYNTQKYNWHYSAASQKNCHQMKEHLCLSTWVLQHCVVLFFIPLFKRCACCTTNFCVTHDHLINSSIYFFLDCNCFSPISYSTVFSAGVTWVTSYISYCMDVHAMPVRTKWTLPISPKINVQWLWVSMSINYSVHFNVIYYTV